MRTVFIFLALTFYLNSYSQDSLLSYFFISETSQQTILLRWEIKSGNTCNGMEIQRSIDDSTYQTIQYISGVCGNSASPVAYQFEDENPISNKTNYYRLKLGLSDPGRSQSLFFVELNTEGYYLYPNPTEDQIKIYFKNENQSETRINLMNQSGQIIQTSRVNSGIWEPDILNLPTGIYIFSIEVDQRIIQGRFIKK